ncbi:MAG: hypothetical protein OSA99_15370 [Acidimicrobiales bacterium]|nr:hypothetical protein [Acidimicrobiales bacterium]
MRGFAGGFAIVLAFGACGGDSNDDAAGESDAPVESDDAALDSKSDASGDSDDAEADDSGSSDDVESPYEVDAVDPVDQGVATLTIDGTTYEFLDVGDPDDERDGFCRKAPIADELEAILDNVDDAGEPIPEQGAEDFFNTLFVDLPYSSTFSPSLEFQIDGGAWTTSTPDLPTEVAWGFSPDGFHAEGTATLYDRDDDTIVTEATFTLTCPEA